MLKIILTLLISLLMPAAFAHDAASHLGKINFPISSDQNVQQYFETGVLYLHSFEYEKARASFQQAKLLAPNSVMPYWGEAMTYNHPLWEEQDENAARAVLKQLATNDAGRVAKAKTQKEKGLIHAVDLLYGAGNKAERDRLYMQAMRQLYDAFPADDEIASFYALSILGATEGERDFHAYMEAASLVESILRRNPEHPGAIHYIIHSYDDPIHAPLGLYAARTYAKTAPDAAHALHMPSHIFLALGLWDDVIASNAAAWEAGVQEEKKTHHYVVHDLHAVDWLSYGYLQKREFKKSYALVKKMESIALTTKTTMAKWYYAQMRAAYILESEDWNADLQSIDMSGVEISARASQIYADVMVMLHKKQYAATIHAAIVALEKLCNSIPVTVPKSQSHIDYYATITANGILAGKIMVRELRAQMKLQQGDVQGAIKYLREATALHDKGSSAYGPPVPAIPAHEMLGDVLLLAGLKHEAKVEYMKALASGPARAHALAGLRRLGTGSKHAGVRLHT